jgi:predicted 2-oxoglutarate/Fe(II)-dependent dioxygenase YbiX
MYMYTPLSYTARQSQSQSQSHITTDDRSASLSWCRSHSGTCNHRFFLLFLKVAVLSLWGALSDERSGLSFINTV